MFDSVTLFGVPANIGLILVTSLGLMCGKNIGGVVGIVYGLFSDVFFGKSLGMYMLVYGVIGYCSGISSKYFSKDNKTSVKAIICFSTIAFEIVVYILKLFFYEADFVMLVFVKKIAFGIIYNVILSSILFKQFIGISDIINRTKKSYYLL